MSIDVVTATDQHGNTASVTITITKIGPPSPIPPGPIITVPPKLP